MLSLTYPANQPAYSVMNNRVAKLPVAENIKIPAGHVGILFNPTLEVVNGHPKDKCAILQGSELFEAVDKEFFVYVRNTAPRRLVIEPGDEIARVLFVKDAKVKSKSRSSSE